MNAQNSVQTVFRSQKHSERGIANLGRFDERPQVLMKVMWTQKMSMKGNRCRIDRM